MTSVLQDWVQELTLMQQSVLLTSLRAPDGLRKNHPVKVLCRWLRRCILISAFDKRVLSDPYEAGGGSFTGACRTDTVRDLEHAVELYLEAVDEIPHHFQLHFMHSAEILGYKHPIHKKWWCDLYRKLVNDAHLYPESEAQMDSRLGDIESQWKDRESTATPERISASRRLEEIRQALQVIHAEAISEIDDQIAALTQGRNSFLINRDLVRDRNLLLSNKETESLLRGISNEII